MKKQLAYLLLAIVVMTQGQFVFGQNNNIRFERTFSNIYNKHLDTSDNIHTSIKPIRKNEVSSYDDILKGLDIKSDSKWLGALMNSSSSAHSDSGATIWLNPILNSGFTLEQGDGQSQNLLDLSAGLNFSTFIKKKWSINFLYLWDFSEYPSHVDEMIQTKNISPGFGYTNGERGYYAEGNILFTADDHFSFELGYGKNFIGDGYRSLFLSDFAYSYPYLKVTANIWKLKYMALFTNYSDIRGTDGNFNDYFHKFSTVHYLSYNATKWLNFGFFESIMWQAQEDDFYRGFDLNYLNPVIFMRPVEYSQGSSDNALLGASVKVKIKKKQILYSQVILDEFLLKELQAGNGWWANKYGVQVGWKSYDFLWVNNLTLQLEYNTVRPFTYSYYHDPTSISTNQNYAHFNSPLAHPLGSNFTELTAGLTYTKKRWIIEGLATIAKVGFDTNMTTSIGQDVYRPYNWRSENYGFTTTGGLTTDIINSTIKVSYIISPESQLMIHAGVTNRMFKNNYDNRSNTMFFIGLRTAIINRYSDF